MRQGKTLAEEKEKMKKQGKMEIKKEKEKKKDRGSKVVLYAVCILVLFTRASLSHMFLCS
jgi:hypothetical protein